MEFLKKLEFDIILNKLEKYCHVEKSKNMALKLHLFTDIQKVRNALQETTEAVNLIQRCGMSQNIFFEEDKHGFKILETYGVLSLKSILNFTQILRLSNLLKKYFSQDFINKEDYPNLQQIFSELYTNTGIISEVEKSVIDENTLDDKASKNLELIRKKQKNIELDIKQKLNNMIHSNMYSKYIQESIVTIRNDRYVIPVKQEYRSQIKGFIHDISSSGSTIFIEPISVFELNNNMADLKMEESLEIEKIIKELTKLFYPYVEELKKDTENLAKLDFIFAKAKFSRDIQGNEPIINNNNQIMLEEARHPLIDKEKVVPITLNIGKNYKSLLITGPNTGGKTVTLKTVGLLTCMACSGLHIPAKKTSSICVFNKIFADIGDEQSIADSLSTFSAHMKNIVEIIKNVDEKTLILLDELGSGTDPVEGQALAISILEELYKKGCITIATTHYQELKKYAMTENGFENASVEFDIQTLTPTYKLLVGVPGKSNAFEISKKLGLKEEIIKNAQNRLEKQDVEFEELVKKIYQDKVQIEEEKKIISSKLEEIEKLRKALEIDNTNLIEKQKSEIENAKIEARNILLNAKQEANDIIKDMEKYQKNIEDNLSIKKANELREDLNSKIKELSINEKTLDIVNNDVDIKPDMKVFVKKFGKGGVVFSKSSKNNEVIVQIGGMKINVPIGDLNIIENEPQKQKINVHSNISKSKNIKTEINVIGQTVEEACFVVDKFLDDCSLAKLQTVRIVHGKGTGKLRNGIHKLLDKNSHVKSYRLGTFGEGEMGVTVVELK